MANLNYADLKLKKDISISMFDWNGKTVEVKKYLPVDSVYDIIMITLQKSYEDGIYNPIKLDVYFHLNLIYLYTNLVFTEEEREDEFKLYDELYSSGFIKKFLEFIDSNEYSEMQDNISEIINYNMEYRNSAASVMRKFIDDLPENAATAAKIVENFDPEKYQAVIDFTKAANNGKLP